MKKCKFWYLEGIVDSADSDPQADSGDGQSTRISKTYVLYKVDLNFIGHSLI